MDKKQFTIQYITMYVSYRKLFFIHDFLIRERTMYIHARTDVHYMHPLPIHLIYSTAEHNNWKQKLLL